MRVERRRRGAHADGFHHAGGRQNDVQVSRLADRQRQRRMAVRSETRDIEPYLIGSDRQLRRAKKSLTIGAE